MCIFKKIKTYSFSTWVIISFLLIAIFADFIANERPLYAKVKGQTYFPVVHQYLEYLGADSYPFLKQKSWTEIDFDQKLMPIIAFSSTSIFTLEQNYKKPGSTTKIQNKNYYHYLGTDAIGRDVAAAMIHGTRLALMIGFLAAFIAFFIGTVIGLLSGFFGDNSISMTWTHFLISLLVNFLLIFYSYYSDAPFLVTSLFFVLINVTIARILPKVQWPSFLSSRINIPFDLLVNRVIEIFNSIPNLLILLTLISVLKNSSIFTIMWIIGFLSWPGVARIVRAETLKTKSKEYITAAKMLNLTDFQIMFRQILPNIWSPIIVAFAFAVSAAILAEATISFLGIGVNPSHVSWGSLLGAARENISAWWLAVFPGIAIFLLVYSLNDIGDHFKKV